MDWQDNSYNQHLDKIYAEASHWVRLANTAIWSMGTLLVPVSFGFVGLALNRSPTTQFTFFGEVLLCFGSIILFSFWVYASALYTKTSAVARDVLTRIEKEWAVTKQQRFYTEQGKVIKVWYRLPNAQMVALVILVVVWAVILTQ